MKGLSQNIVCMCVLKYSLIIYDSLLMKIQTMNKLVAFLCLIYYSITTFYKLPETFTKHANNWLYN